LQERCYPRARFWVIVAPHQNSDQPHALRLLRARRKRPRGSRTAEKRYKSRRFITRSPRAGTRTIWLAVFR